MNPQSTDKITEDTAGLQRKIVYRGQITSTNSSDTVISETLTQFDMTKQTYTVEFFPAGTSSTTYEITHYNRADQSGAINANGRWSYVTVTNGKLTVNFDLDQGAYLHQPGFTFYGNYIVYSTKITDTVAL